MVQMTHDRRVQAQPQAASGGELPLAGDSQPVNGAQPIGAQPTGAMAAVDPQVIARRVYELMQADLRVYRTRRGFNR